MQKFQPQRLALFQREQGKATFHRVVLLRIARFLRRSDDLALEHHRAPAHLRKKPSRLPFRTHHRRLPRPSLPSRSEHLLAAGAIAVQQFHRIAPQRGRVPQTRGLDRRRLGGK
ncbi:MAG: hypothetical protein KBC32_03220 [Candidatus Didemnitutus sp.]|nr:hypothetical protein [Candidatus Didemnitutus sp.]